MADFTSNPTNTTSYNDTVYAAIINDDILDALQAAVVTPPLLSQFDLSGQPSKAVDIPIADAASAAAVSEGSELSNTQLTTSKVTLTASEVGIMATITDVLDVSSIATSRGAQMRQLGNAMAQKLDVDICALFSGFSNTVGSTGTDLSLANVFDAIYGLESNNAPGPYVAVLHPRQIADLRTAINAASGAVFTGQGVRAGSNELGTVEDAGYFGTFMNIDFYQSTNVPTANAAADRAGAVFSKDYALGMVKKWSSKTEIMRWAPIRGFVVVVSSMYGVGEIIDGAGQAVVTDA